MKRRYKLFNISVIIFILVINSIQVYAHGGRTDGSGGHRDKNNVSGLGSYHYHHGMGPHLHPDGVCPYSNNGSSSSTNKTPVVPATPKKSISLISIPTAMKVGDENPISWKTTNDLDKYQVTWSSSDTSIASVDSLGVVKAYKKGRVLITGKLDNITRTFTLNVSEVGVDSVQIINKLDKVEVGTEQRITYKIMPDNATNKKVTWESSNNDVAEISSEGLIKAHSIGSTTIKIKTANGSEDRFNLEVFEIKPTAISTSMEKIELFIGESIQLKASVIPENATNKKIEYNISEDGYFTYADNEVKAINAGESSIVFNIGGVVKEVPIIVKDIPVEKIEIDMKSIPFKFGKYLLSGSTFSPAVTVYPNNATNAKVTFYSKESTVKINDNNIEVLGNGSGTIVVKAGEIEESIEFNVIDLNGITNGSLLTLGALTIGGTSYFKIKRRKAK